jgi:hypothetical protein
LRSRDHFLLLQGGAGWNCGPWQGSRRRNPRRPAAPCLRRPAVQQKWIRIVLRCPRLPRARQRIRPRAVTRHGADAGVGTSIAAGSAKRANSSVASPEHCHHPGTFFRDASTLPSSIAACRRARAPSVRNRGFFYRPQAAPSAISVPGTSPRGTGCLLRGSGARAYFSTRRKGGCRRFGLGGGGGGRMIPASSKSSRTCSLIKSRTLAEAISRASSSTGCGLDHFRCS